MKRFLEKLRSYFPSKLPHGMSEFLEWSSSIIRLSRAPENDSTRFAVAVMIMHMKPTEDSKPKNYFVKQLNKGAANELANAICLDLKEKQRQRAEEETLKKAQHEVQPNKEV